ncbi:MAG TPA: type II toxin-antitoxin system VapB family antitoxin [Terracidiphilus sp.]|jgi:antitoxin VapB|nr:type II toxin-antitoxin system VapB family antitoxin [Terracidiphilus sp.]
MGLNIKNPETEELARELARRTGETLTTAITKALRERLERLEKAKRAEGRMEWLERITAETAPLMNDGRSSKELFDELYDEKTGLPK